MALVFTGRESEREQTEKLNALASAVTRWDKLAVGPGLEVRRHAGGILLNVKPQAAVRKAAGEAEDCSGGDLQTIQNTIGTQDSDTWANSSGKQVAIDLITDISWDAVNGLIVGRMRTLTFDKCGNLKSIGGEGTLVTLITTESCAAP
jgi:hypothetical protein